MYTEEMLESPELMQAIFESYLDANPILKTYTQGINQLISFFTNSIFQTGQMHEQNQNDSINPSKNESKESKNEKKDSQPNQSSNEDEDTNNNASDNNNMENKAYDQNNKENQQVPDFSNFFNGLLQMFSQMTQGNNLQNCPLFSSFTPMSSQQFQDQQTNQDKQSKKQEDDKYSLIQDIILQVLNPEMYEQSPDHSAKNNDNDNEKESGKEDKKIEFLDMIKIIYQIFMNDKNLPGNFTNSFGNIISQIFPLFDSIFSAKPENSDLNFPFAHIFPQPEKEKKSNRRAELRRSKFVDSKGNVVRRTRHSIGDQWYEIVNVIGPDGETIQSTNETWNNISEEQFENFKNEWEDLYKKQSI
ncbi:hypothetical protein M9Y10_029491 [Tritrichomonas musculus]|uniref:Uncharacterized protein n=1 Tax=Tritrichomonas musculus TaxID=1915356 RepID=A0ABR2KND2_9EUKA